MDAARQVLRFSIPGSITLLLTAGLLGLGRLLQGDPLEGIAASVADNMGGLVPVLATIPVGFVVYQVYYSTYRPFVWPWPGPGRGPWIRIDRGAQVLSALSAGQRAAVADLFEVELSLEPAAEPVRSGVGRRLRALELRDDYRFMHEDPEGHYRRRWRTNWDVMRVLVEISDGSDVGAVIKAEYTILSDLYHALGACRTGVQVAWGVSLIISLGYVLEGNGELSDAMAAAALGGVPSALLAWIFHRTRGQTWMSAQAALKLGLVGLFKRRPDLLEPPLR